MNVFSADVALAITRLGLLILLGWFMARQGWVGAHARQPLMRMIIWVFFPAMIFSRVSGNPLIASGSQALLYLGAGFLMIVTGYAVATLIGSVSRCPADPARRACRGSWIGPDVCPCPCRPSCTDGPALGLDLYPRLCRLCRSPCRHHRARHWPLTAS